MKAGKIGLRLYRGLYWANQGLLHAARALKDAEFPPSAQPASSDLSSLNDRLNRDLAEWIDRQQ